MSPANERIMYEKLCQIPVILKTDKEGKPVDFEYNAELPEDELESDDRRERLSEIRKYMKEDPHIKTLYIEAMNLKDKMSKEVHRLAKVEVEKGELGLVERNQLMRRHINQYFDTLVTATETGMKELGYTRKIAAKVVGHNRKNGRTKKKGMNVSSDTKFQKMRKARRNINRLHNIAEQCTRKLEYIRSEFENQGTNESMGNIEEKDMNEIYKEMIYANKSIKIIKKYGERWINEGHEVMKEIQEEIENIVSKERNEEAKNCMSLDPYDGRKINREKSILLHMQRKDDDIYRRMDRLLEVDDQHKQGYLELRKENNQKGKEEYVEEDETATMNSNSHMSMLGDGDNNNKYWYEPIEPGWNSNKKCIDTYNRHRQEGIRHLVNSLEKTIGGIRRLRDGMGNSNKRRWLKRIRGDVLKNDLKGVTQSMIKPPKTKPEPHPWILADPNNPRDEDGELRWVNAKNPKDMLEGTKQKHFYWTNNNDERQNIYPMKEYIDHNGNKKFELRKVPKEGISEKDIEDLFREDLVLTDDIKEHIKGAHNETSTSIFNKVKCDPNFIYPFAVNPESPEMIFDTKEFKNAETDIYKSLVKGHGKARHKNFYLSVVARLGIQWAELWVEGFKYVLAMRIAPKVIKELSRCPIPKPKPGETRPLALVHDGWALVNGIIHDHLAKAIEESGAFDEDIIAYRRGKGAMDAMVPIILMLEEAFATGRFVAILDEDEEKYFDRILEEIQIATMKAIGIPEQGYLEMKSEDMSERECTILTSIGEVVITYKVGLPQGQKLSVLACNTTSNAKRRAWRSKNERHPMPWDEGYTFASVDEEDVKHGRIRNLHNKVYSDDAQLIIADGKSLSLEERMTLGWESSLQSIPEETEMEEGQSFMERQAEELKECMKSLNAALGKSGDNSIVCKLPRNGAKSSVVICNVPQELVDQVDSHISTTEYSYAKARTKTSLVRVQVSLRRPGPDATSEEIERYENSTMIRRTLLGVDYLPNGDASLTGLKGIASSRHKINTTQIPENLGPKGTATMVNTYITNEMWGLVIAKADPKQLMKLDKQLTKRVRPNYGKTSHDCAIDIFLPFKQYGGGIIGFVDTNIKAIGREMEELLANPFSQGAAARGSLKLSEQLTLKESKDIGYTRAMDHNIETLAGYGIYIRDMRELDQSIFLELLRKRMHEKSISVEFPEGKLDRIGRGGFTGVARFKEPYVGGGNKALMNFKLNGKFSKVFVKRVERANNRKSLAEDTRYWTTEIPIEKDELKEVYQSTIDTIQNVFKEGHTWEEWTISKGDEDPLAEDAKWVVKQSNWKVDLVNDNRSVQEQLEKQIIKHGQKSRISYLEDEYEDITEMIAENPLPPAIATDGSHVEGKNGARSRNTATATILICENHDEDETGRDVVWKPIMSRRVYLPDKIGAEKVDNGHCEAMAICLAEEMLPTALPALLISDSLSTIGGYRLLRDGNIPNNRTFVRRILSGIGKCFMVRLLRNVALWSKPTMNYLKHSACILHSHGKSKTPFKYSEGDSNLSYKHLIEEEDEEDEDEINKEEREIKDALQLLEFLSNNKSNKSADEVVTYVGATLAFKEESFDIKKQRIKLQNFVSSFKDSISNEKRNRYPEKYVDDHPHRTIMMVNSHQYKKDDDEPTGRLDEITPFKSAAMMNHLADKICDTKFINETVVDRIFDTYGLRYRIFGGGEEINKSIPRTIQKCLHEERRMILAVRPAHGLIARVGDRIDTNAIECGQKGNFARHMRGQGASIVRAVRLDKDLKMLHVLQIEGKFSDSTMDINKMDEKDKKKYLKDPLRSSGVYELCKVCGKDAIENHKRGIEDFWQHLSMSKEERRMARENNNEVWQEPRIEMDDWRRHSVLHSCVCECKIMIAARNMGNELIERNLKRLFKYADEIVAENSLYNYLMEKLKDYEREEYVGCKKRNEKNVYDRILYKRQVNKTILKTHEWERLINDKNTINDKEFDKEMALESVKNFKYGTTLGIFKPESINMTPIHEQCVLDTCWAGWTPSIYQELIGDWFNEMKKQGCFQGRGTRNMKSELTNLYRQLKTAIYIKADLMSKVSRSEVHNYKKELIQQMSSDASANMERLWRDEFEIEEGYLIGYESNDDEDDSSTSGESNISDMSLPDMDDIPREEESEKEEDDEEEETEEPTTTKSKRKASIQCTKTRCRIAKAIGKNTGKVTDESKTCGKCNNFNNDLESFEKWENILIQQCMSTLVWCVNNTTSKNNKNVIEDMLKKATKAIEEEQEDGNGNTIGLKHSTRHISMLANTLTVNTVNNQSDSIDKKPTPKTNESIRDEAIRLCNCEEDSEIMHIGNQNEIELPNICGRCKRVRAIPTDEQNKSNCRACGSKISKKLKCSPQGVCQECQVKCLIITNNLRNRYNKMREDLDDEEEGGSPTKRHARNMTKEGGTDPTLVSKKGNNSKEQIEERLNRRIRKETNEDVNEMHAVDKYTLLWKAQYDRREKTSYKVNHILDTGKGLDNRLLAALLANLNKTYEGCEGTFGVVSMLFTHQLQNSDMPWDEMRNKFLQCEYYDWENPTEAAPLINSDVLWIPTCTEFGDTYSKWALVVRFVKDRDEEAEEPYMFVVIDPRDNSIKNTTAKEMKKLIRRKTNLQDNYNNIHNDEVNDEDTGNSTRWYQCTKGPLIEKCEDGYRLLLNMVICFTASSTNDLDRRMESLNEIEDLDIKTRQWILSILEGRRTFKWDDVPKWLSEITRMKDKQSTQQTSEEESEEEDDESEEDKESEEEEEEEEVCCYGCNNKNGLLIYCDHGDCIKSGHIECMTGGEQNTFLCQIHANNNNNNSRDKRERELRNRRKRLTEVRKEVEDESEDGNSSEQQQKKVRFSNEDTLIENDEEEQSSKGEKTIRWADETTSVNQIPNINELLEERSFECDHMRTIIPNMASYTTSDIMDIDFYHRLICENRELESTWEEIRRYMNPGNTGAFKPNTNSTNSTACIDAEKLIIPIQTANPEHFTCVIRFPATQNNVTWDFAFIDSMNKDELSMKVRDTIQKETTLANDYPNLENIKPNVENVSATWRRIECKKQMEVECGARMLLHIYIATQSTNITELEKKIQRLNQVEELQIKARQWAVEWLKYEVAETPTWLENVLK